MKETNISFQGICSEVTNLYALQMICLSFNYTWLLERRKKVKRFYCRTKV